VSTVLEREVKLRFDSADAARAAIERTEATPLRSRRLQDDYLLDDPGETLRLRRCVLRVRTEAGRSLLTFKGPVQPSPMKLREEIETVVGDGETLLRCFEHLGYRVWFRYQKYREEYALGDATIALDETPVGVFVEIEGSEQGITDAARALGRSEREYILDSYRGLFMESRRSHGLPATDMIFEESALGS
jgi:adenylate cyclase class 2